MRFACLLLFFIGLLELFIEVLALLRAMHQTFLLLAPDQRMS